MYVVSLSITREHCGLAAIGFSTGLIRRQRPLSITASTRISDRLPTPIDRIREDHEGVLWLATAKGLYRFDPASGRTTRYIHDPDDRSSIVANRINVAAEDREGRLWVASAGGLDQLDRRPERWCGVPHSCRDQPISRR